MPTPDASELAVLVRGIFEQALLRSYRTSQQMLTFPLGFTTLPPPL